MSLVLTTKRLFSPPLSGARLRRVLLAFRHLASQRRLTACIVPVDGSRDKQARQQSLLLLGAGGGWEDTNNARHWQTRMGLMFGAGLILCVGQPADRGISK